MTRVSLFYVMLSITHDFLSRAIFITIARDFLTLVFLLYVMLSHLFGKPFEIWGVSVCDW